MTPDVPALLAAWEGLAATERILREGDPYYETEASAWERRSLDIAGRQGAALRAVLDLHRPVRVATSGSTDPKYVPTYKTCCSCDASGSTFHPCRTVRAITAALTKEA